MKEFSIAPESEFDGFVQFFTKKGRGNVYRYITAEGVGVDSWGPASTVLDYSIKGTDITDQWVSKGEEANANIVFTFSIPIYLTNYTMRTRTDNNRHESYQRNWVVEGSNNKSNWFIIDTKANNQKFQENGDVATFMCDSPTKYVEYVRIRLTAATHEEYSRSYWYLHISRVEFFGKNGF